jgi:hypothetical protein
MPLRLWFCALERNRSKTTCVRNGPCLSPGRAEAWLPRELVQCAFRSRRQSWAKMFLVLCPCSCSLGFRAKSASSRHPKRGQLVVHVTGLQKVALLA